MSARFRCQGAVQALLIFLLAVSGAARVAGAGKTRIFVVAVHDSALFTMCPSAAQLKNWGYVGRTQNLEFIQNPDGPRLTVPRHIVQLDRPVVDRSRAEWWNIVGRAPGMSPSGKMDPDLKRGMDREFSRQGDYLVADAVEQADLVFVAEGIYADPYGAAGVSSGRSRSSGNPVLALIMAVAVPADVYQRNPADSELLLAAGRWAGADSWRSNPPEVDRQPAAEPASPERLVRQFIERKDEKPKFPALCAARMLAPAVDALGMPRLRPGVQSGAAGAQAGEGDTASGNLFRVSVSLVTVPAIVSDAAGGFVPGLSVQDFHVFENGVEQKIDRVIPEITPFNVVLMLDTSGSTIFQHRDIQEAALAFVEALRPEDRVMVVSFDSYIYLDAPFTRDRAALRRAILRTDTGAGTRLYDALDVVLTECLGKVQGRKAIVLFTDGIDSQSWLASFGNSRNKVEESDALVYAVQFDTMIAGSASKYLKGLSENSGGRLFQASSIANLKGAFAGIAEELQHQYTICYYPANQGADAAFRPLQVTVDKPGTRIRARTGYRVPQ
jgi:Ca-activated chloride channel homolog